MLVAACHRYKLSVLATGSTPTAQLKPISFRDLSSSKATSKAKKATAKGFAAAANKQASSNRQPPAAAELSEEQLQQVVECNAYGDDHVDAALAACRGEQQHSVVGKHHSRLLCSCPVAHSMRWLDAVPVLRQRSSAARLSCTRHFPRIKLHDWDGMLQQHAIPHLGALGITCRCLARVFPVEPLLCPQHCPTSADVRPPAAAHCCGGASWPGGDNIIPERGRGHASSAEAGTAPEGLWLRMQLS